MTTTIAAQRAPALHLSFDLVKHVIDVRKVENRIAAEARAKSEQKQKILGVIALDESYIV